MEFQKHLALTAITMTSFAGSAYLLGLSRPIEAAAVGFMYSMGCKVVRYSTELLIKSKKAEEAPRVKTLAYVVRGVAFVALGIGSFYIAPNYAGVAITFKAAAIAYGTCFVLSRAMQAILLKIKPDLFKEKKI